MKFLNKLLPFLPFIFVFIASLYVPTDPDLGWHLKYGEYFFQNGNVLRENTFSTMMQEYQWANTSWLTDILTYGVFNLAGFLGLSILGALVVTATLYVFSKVARLTVWDQVLLFPFILYLVQPVNQVSFRGQQLSLLLIGVLFYILSKYHDRPKMLLLLIPLFLLWANLHGQFILGLGLFGLWIGLSFVKNMYLSLRRQRRASLSAGKAKQIKIRLLLRHLIVHDDIKKVLFVIGVFLASCLATVVNPFGIGIHSAAIDHIGSPLLKDIAEYLPFEMYSMGWWNQIIAGVLIVFGFIGLFFNKKITQMLPILGAGILLFVLSFEVRRYAWPAYYLILPLLSPIAAYLKPDGKKMTSIFTFVFACVLIGISVQSRYPFTQFTNYSWDTYCETTKCSQAAATYLKNNNLTQNVYTLYGWGGWLIWNHPQVKPSIDGRMHLWQDGEYSAFKEYYEVEQNRNDIDATDYNTVLIAPDKPVYERLIKLENGGKWKMVFSDKNAAVFVRNRE